MTRARTGSTDLAVHTPNTGEEFDTVQCNQAQNSEMPSNTSLTYVGCTDLLEISVFTGGLILLLSLCTKFEGTVVVFQKLEYSLSIID